MNMIMTKVDYYGSKMNWTGNFKEDVKRARKAVEFPLAYEYFHYEYVQKVMKVAKGGE